LEASKKLAYFGELSASIAHEVNNPLGVIVMNSSFLEKRRAAGGLSPGAAEEVGRLSAAAKRATLAVQKLLQFARHTTERMPVRHKRVHLQSIVRETLDLFEDHIQVAGCGAQVDIPENLRPVNCDAEGIQQVLFNLLANAIDASPKGGEIRIKVTSDSECCSISVSDQGQGMSPDVVGRAKEMFFSTKGPERGTGLGLAISDAIVKNHAGELLLQSRLGQGTTVTVRLPVKRTSEG
jgi:two-component system NtrC family sensor kinase